MMGSSLLVYSLVFSLSALAAENQTSEDLLIEKLSRIQVNLALKDPSKVPVSLRLADLYAERARLKSLKELNEGCTVCMAGKQDREQALRYYMEVLDRVPLDQQGRVMLQVGHLYEMNGEENKALDFYQNLLKKSGTTLDAQMESHFSLAEIYFKKRQFPLAYEHYLKVAGSTAASKGRAAYRSAWCLFNMGKLEQASREFEFILSTPELMTKSVGVQKEVDTQFQEEVSRDWITILAQQKWDAKSPEKIYRLSPEKNKISLLVTLALELERVGKRPEALNTWEYAFQNISDSRIKLQAHTHRAVLYQETDIKKAVENFESALALWKDNSDCQNVKTCDEEYKLLRHFIIGWNKKEKQNPSAELVEAYKKYLALFSQESDMRLWLAQLAEQIKNYPLAQEQYQKVSLLLKDSEQENAMLKQLEMAEQSKNSTAIMQAQDFYLKESVKKSKQFEVRYQRLRQTYEQNQYAEAFTGLKALALESQGTLALRKQAADLALDCLVLTKEDDKLQTTAMEFSEIFKSQEYKDVYQKTLLSQSAKLSELGQTQAALDTLMKFDAGNASHADRVILVKNKILLLQKLNRFDQVRPLVDELLTIPQLSKEDQGFAWAQKAYLAELFLDFKTAKMATEKIQVKSGAEEKTKTLKLALFSELLGEKANKEYQDLLKNTDDAQAKTEIMAKIIRVSANPEAEWIKAKNQFAQNPELYTRLALEIYKSRASQNLIKTVLADKKLVETPAGELMRTHSWIQEFDTLKSKLVSQNLETKKQSDLARTIKIRAQTIEKLEALVAKAIENKDWTAQLLGLQLLSQESQRFYQDLLSAPLPAGLTPEEEQSYLSILSSQAAPYQAKGTDAAQKVQEFWAHTEWKKSIEVAWQDEVLKFFLQNEITHLKEIASDEIKKTLTDITSVVSEKPTLAELETARNKVRENPLNIESLKSLKDLEMKSRNMAMVQYLEIRVKEKQ